jgi:hypothetical protein
MAWSGLETHQCEKLKYKEKKCAMNCIRSHNVGRLASSGGDVRRDVIVMQQW